jgi:hypothetical protein
MASEERTAFQELVEVLIANLEEVPPVQILYMPARSDVLTVIWGVLTILSEIMRKQLQKRLTEPAEQ